MKLPLALSAFAISVVGLTVVFISQYLGLAAGTTLLYLGVICSLFGAGLLGISLYEINRRVIREVKRLQQNNEGLAWILAVAIMTVCLWPFIYWAIGMPYATIDGFVSGARNWTGFIGNVMLFQRVMIAALPGFILFAVLLWSVVNSKAQTFEG